MRRPTIAALAALIAWPLVFGCGPPTPDPRQPPAAGQPGAGQAEAFKAVEDLEAAIDEARKAVGSASATSATATEEQRIRLSDARRAVVAANVALQKAREALGRGDDAAAKQAILGVGEHLREVVGKMKR
jgi:flagellar hook-basal body complex protein FliE